MSTNDPFLEPFWTLPMALAWIIWADPDQVAAHSDKFLGAGTFQEELADGRVVTRKAELLPTLSLYMNTARSRLPMRMTIEQANESLWRELKRGSLEGRGLSERSGESVVVPRGEWSNLEGSDDNHGRGAYILRDKNSNMPLYRDIEVDAALVRKLWRAPLESRRQEERKDETTSQLLCNAALEAYVQVWRDSDSSAWPARVDWERIAVEVLGPFGASTYTARNSWRAGRPHDWDKPGPRKGCPNFDADLRRACEHALKILNP